MSTARHVRLPYRKGFCRKCGGAVPKGRLCWCGQECIDAHKATTPAGFRAAVFARDRGVCAGCGRDCEALRAKIVRRLQGRYADGPAKKRAWQLATFLVRMRILAFWVDEPRSLWEADHVVPVVEGGGGTGPENGRTLCRPCHKRETAALAKRRAEARRPQLGLPLGVAR